MSPSTYFCFSSIQAKLESSTKSHPVVNEGQEESLSVSLPPPSTTSTSTSSSTTTTQPPAAVAVSRQPLVNEVQGVGTMIQLGATNFIHMVCGLPTAYPPTRQPVGATSESSTSPRQPQDNVRVSLNKCHGFIPEVLLSEMLGNCHTSIYCHSTCP